ncbi:MAG: cyclic nucleotide-binding domain-containing protein [Ghiorsea sp.]
MAVKITKKALEEALNTYSNLVDAYPNNESYLQRYAEMLQALGREATATLTLQHLHDTIAKRSEVEARAFAQKHPQIGRIQIDSIIFDDHDKHATAGKIIFELLGTIWLKLHQKKYKEGQVICRSDDLSDTLTLILDGNIDAYAVHPDNTRVLVENIGIHDVLGEHTFFKPSRMNIDAFVASPEAIAVQVPREKLLKILSDNHYLENILSQRALFRTNVHTLARNHVFKSMPLKLCKYLARKLSLKHYETGQNIYALQQPMDGIDIIIAGSASHVAKNKQQEKILLSPLPAFSISGDVRLKGKGTPSLAELVAQTRTTVAHIAFNDILTVSVAFPLLKERLLQHSDEQKVLIMQEITQH